MNNKWLILINPLIAVLMASQAVTALNAVFPFLERKVFVAIHVYGGCLLVALVACHFSLNLFWFKTVFRKKKPAPPAKTPGPPAA